MFNAPHLLETALLMLAAFLLGAVVGLVLRLVLARPKPAVAPVVEARPAELPSAAPDLVQAPQIAPISRPGAAAGTGADETGMQSAVKMPAHALPGMPPIRAIQPSRTAGETVAGRHIDNPEHRRAASLADVRAELEARIDAASVPVESAAPDDAVATAKAEIAAALAKPDEPLPEAPATEVEAPMPAEVSGEAEEKLPVEERVEPELEVEPMVLMDSPRELAAELQDVIETLDEDPVPDVLAEAPLVEPVYEKQEDEAAADRLFPSAEPEPQPQPAEDELEAMRAIEGGWTPRSPASSRRPADLPEGVSPAEMAAADRAVADSGAAVANAAAAVTAALDNAVPANVNRPAGGFGRPAALPAPRDGGKDDLGQIKGLGPAIESSLNGLGIYHYDQVAGWDQKAVVWIENHFGFRGRIARERWQEQARDLGRGRVPVARPVRR